MTENEKHSDDRKVWCRRLERKLPVAEHADCPYCFGDKPEIAQGEHADFCDFRPGQDPVNFGFPPDTSRNLTE